MDMEKGGEAFKTLAMIWGDEEKSVDLEYSRFDFTAYDVPAVKGYLWIDYTWASEKDAKVPVVADDAGNRRFLADDEKVDDAIADASGAVNDLLGGLDLSGLLAAASTPNYDHWLR